MRVVTPAITLDLRIDKIESANGRLLLTGVAGMLPCEATLDPSEIRRLFGLAFKPALFPLLMAKDPPPPAKTGPGKKKP